MQLESFYSTEMPVVTLPTHKVKGPLLLLQEVVCGHRRFRERMEGEMRAGDGERKRRDREEGEGTGNFHILLPCDKPLAKGCHGCIFFTITCRIISRLLCLTLITTATAASFFVVAIRTLNPLFFM